MGDGLDSSQPGARQIIAFLAEQARTEVLNTAWRVEQFHEGARRAGQWVRKPPYGYLVEHGISADRLQSQGYGETQPLDSRSNEGAWKKNRRVEVAIYASEAMKKQLQTRGN